MEQHTSQWGFVIAAANAVLAITFLWFGLSLAKRRGSAPFGRFRTALGSWLLGLGVFFAWIMLAWATVIDFSEPVQAASLTICAGLGVRALMAWRATSAVK